MDARSKLYDRDFYAWTREQAALLREGRVSDMDLANLAEEIESMGRREKRELVHPLTGLLLHLAQWRVQAGLRSGGWRLGVKGQRLDVVALLDESPSLRDALDAALAQGWRRARIRAQIETGFDAALFPDTCPWSAEQALDDTFWPD